MSRPTCDARGLGSVLPDAVEDLLWALSDGSIDAVWCARDGYGTARTVAALDGGALGCPKSAIPLVQQALGCLGKVPARPAAAGRAGRPTPRIAARRSRFRG